MIVACPECSAQFRIPPERVKGSGVKVRCSKCKHVFAARKPERAPAVGGTTPPPVSTPPPMSTSDDDNDNDVDVGGGAARGAPSIPSIAFNPDGDAAAPASAPSEPAPSEVGHAHTELMSPEMLAAAAGSGAPAPDPGAGGPGFGDVDLGTPLAAATPEAGGAGLGLGDPSSPPGGLGDFDLSGALNRLDASDLGELAGGADPSSPLGGGLGGSVGGSDLGAPLGGSLDLGSPGGGLDPSSPGGGLDLGSPGGGLDLGAPGVGLDLGAPGGGLDLGAPGGGLDLGATGGGLDLGPPGGGLDLGDGGGLDFSAPSSPATPGFGEPGAFGDMGLDAPTSPASGELEGRTSTPLGSTAPPGGSPLASSHESMLAVDGIPGAVDEPAHSGIGSLLFLILLVFNLFCAFVLWRNDWRADLRKTGPMLEIALGVAPETTSVVEAPAEAPAAVARVELVDVRTLTYPNEHGQTLLVVEGLGRNTGDLAVSGLFVQGRLIDPGTSASVALVRVPAGGSFGPDLIQSFRTAEDVSRAYGPMAAKAKSTLLDPEASVPFSVVFAQLPEDFSTREPPYQVKVEVATFTPAEP